ncbi:MAG: NAD-glutamate dehydrogenase, partial [Vibrio sp.]
MPTREHVAPVLLEKVVDLIQSKLDANSQPLVIELANQLFRNVSQADLQQRHEADLFGAVVSLWQHLHAQDPTQASVRVFNPSLRKDGWKSSHTVVEIVLPDTAFLVDSIKMTLTRYGMTSHFMANVPLKVAFNQTQPLKVTSIGQDKGQMHSIFHIEIDRLDDKAQMKSLEQELVSVLADTQLVVSDWKPMVAQLNTVIDDIQAKQASLPI